MNKSDMHMKFSCLLQAPKAARVSLVILMGGGLLRWDSDTQVNIKYMRIGEVNEY